jgi:AraC-like DNA-binding protein
MSYIEILPDNHLRPYIECYWSQSNNVAPHIVLPDGCIDIVFNEGAGFVVGTMTAPIVVEPLGSYVGVRFRSAKASAFLNFDASELTDQKTELRNIAHLDGSGLVERLFDAKTLSKKIQVLNTTLSSWFRPKTNDNVDDVIQKIAETQGNISINSICNSVDLSRQHLARLFQEYVGIRPKQFARVIRFQALLKNVRQNRKKINWADQAAMLGYYDQAHLISDFRQFSGTSPEKFTSR